MAYTICDPDTGDPKPIRLIADHQPGESPKHLMFQVCNPVEPEDWTCDPCNMPARRYRIVWRGGIEEYRPWWEVIAPDDTDHDVAVKLQQCVHAKTARINLERAERDYRRICGVAA